MSNKEKRKEFVFKFSVEASFPLFLARVISTWMHHKSASCQDLAFHNCSAREREQLLRSDQISVDRLITLRRHFGVRHWSAPLPSPNYQRRDKETMEIFSSWVNYRLIFPCCGRERGWWLVCKLHCVYLSSSATCSRFFRKERRTRHITQPISMPRWKLRSRKVAEAKFAYREACTSRNSFFFRCCRRNKLGAVARRCERLEIPERKPCRPHARWPQFPDWPRFIIKIHSLRLRRIKNSADEGANSIC